MGGGGGFVMRDAGLEEQLRDEACRIGSCTSSVGRLLRGKINKSSSRCPPLPCSRGPPPGGHRRFEARSRSWRLGQQRGSGLTRGVSFMAADPD